MDYKARNIGFRVDESHKTFCVIINHAGEWKECGAKQLYPCPMPILILATARFPPELAFLLLRGENPSDAEKFLAAVSSPREYTS
jgi:hypothetical protein